MIVTVLVYTALILLAVVLLCLAVIWLEKKFPGENYDEMQTLSRLRSYRLAFWTGILYFLFIIPVLIDQIDGTKTIEPLLLMTGGFLLQMLVCQTYCLLTHAALPLSENPLIAMASYALMGIAQFLTFRVQLDNHRMVGMTGPIPLTGRGSMLWFNVAAGIFFLYIALLHAIQFLRNWKE